MNHSALEKTQPAQPAKLQLLQPPEKNRVKGVKQAMAAAFLVAALIVVQLAVSAVNSSYAFQVSQLQETRQQLALSKSDAERQLAVYNSPQYLLGRLKELGMTGSMEPAYLRLSDGVILGDPTPADINNSFDMGNLVANRLLDDQQANGVGQLSDGELSALLSQGLFPVPVTN